MVDSYMPMLMRQSRTAKSDPLLIKISNLSDMRSPQVQFALQTAQMNDIASN